MLRKDTECFGVHHVYTVLLLRAIGMPSATCFTLSCPDILGEILAWLGPGDCMERPERNKRDTRRLAVYPRVSYQFPCLCESMHVCSYI